MKPLTRISNWLDKVMPKFWKETDSNFDPDFSACMSFLLVAAFSIAMAIILGSFAILLYIKNNGL